ncbi:MAG: ATP-binding protein [Candidatus Eremiobacterota bacterium]
MRLRSRLLLLLAGSLAAVLLVSLAVIYRDVRSQIVAEQNRTLQVSLAAFRNLEEQRFQRLELLGRILEAEPGFRTILRRTDYATLKDHVLTVVLPEYELDLVALTDARGRILFDSSREAPGQALERPSVSLALEGQGAADYWAEGSRLYQIVSLPLTDAGDLVDGTVSVGLEVRHELLVGLERDTTSQVLIAASGARVASTFPPGQEVAVLDCLVPGERERRFETRLGRTDLEVLQAPLLDCQGKPTAYLLLGQNTRDKLAFLEVTRRKLYLLGLLALGLAMAASYPLIGRLANPVERMERAQAELQAVVRANLDGLVALDRQGRITLANPAAALALGRAPEELSGLPLSGLLPEVIAADLLGDRRVEQAVLEREGFRWELTRTFVRAGEGEVGSLVVLREVTRAEEERARERELFQRLACLDGLAHLARRNLAWLAVPGDSPHVRVSWEDLVGRLDGVRVELEDPPAVEADPDALELALRNLLSNASQPAVLRVSRDGGAARVTVSDPGPGIPPGLETAVLEGPVPRPAVPGRPRGLGLGLWVVQDVLERHGARLSLSRGAEFSVSFTLPAARS